MIKYRLYYDKDEEADFLNEMSRQGWAMTGFFAGIYSFDKCRPGEYIYQVDITEGMFRVSNDYREFMRDVDVEIVCLWGPWVILRKKASEGPFELYTDVESRIEHYTRIRRLFQICSVIEAICWIVEGICALNGASMALPCFFLLAAITISMLRELIRVKSILAELKSRDGMGTGEVNPIGKGHFFRFLAMGFLLSGIGLLMAEFGMGESVSSLLKFFKGFFYGLAMVALVVGIIHVWQGRK